jgi:DNA-binding NarL/FixJ family response regulator
MQQSDKQEKTSNGKLKVLAADDSKPMRERLVELVRELDTTAVIREAVDTASAVELAQSLKPDIAILDIRMPGGGINALERIKAGPDAPIVIMFTAFPSIQLRDKCLSIGADYFFDKVSEVDDLMETLEQIVAKFCLPKMSGGADR